MWDKTASRPNLSLYHALLFIFRLFLLPSKKANVFKLKTTKQNSWVWLRISRGYGKLKSLPCHRNRILVSSSGKHSTFRTGDSKHAAGLMDFTSMKGTHLTHLRPPARLTKTGWTAVTIPPVMERWSAGSAGWRPPVLGDACDLPRRRRSLDSTQPEVQTCEDGWRTDGRTDGASSSTDGDEWVLRCRGSVEIYGAELLEFPTLCCLWPGCCMPPHGRIEGGRATSSGAKRYRMRHSTRHILYFPNVW